MSAPMQHARRTINIRLPLAGAQPTLQSQPPVREADQFMMLNSCMHNEMQSYKMGTPNSDVD